MTLKVSWLAGGSMSKFHAFPSFSIRSLCTEWTRMTKIDKGVKFIKNQHKAKQKCKQCVKVLQELNGKQSKPEVEH